MSVAGFFAGLLGDDAPVGFEAYDGSRSGPADARARVVIRRVDALRRLLTSPDELGVARAYVAGDIDLEGDVFEIMALQDRLVGLRISPRHVVELVRLVGPAGLRPLAPPPEEASIRGRLHSKARDAEAIAHHYDVSDEFYRIVLGPSMTYSCAVWAGATGDSSSPAGTLEDAQWRKHELVCRKLGLRSGMRLLDIGCGWGGMVLHAAREHGVHAVGVTLSQRQADHARKVVADAGLADRIEIRYQDYRDVADGPYDAISSIGMFEHVGWEQLAEYFDGCAALLAPGARLLNHAISEPPQPHRSPLVRAWETARDRLRRGLPHDFFDRYVFPDGELHEVGLVISAIQRAGLEARHMESLREHYALTLRCWIANLEARWSEATREASEARARVWRLYMAASVVGFERDDLQIHQVLAVKPDAGRSAMPLRPDFSTDG